MHTISADWGNFQDPTRIDFCQKERKLFGSFYFRFPYGESAADVYGMLVWRFDQFGIFIFYFFFDQIAPLSFGIQFSANFNSPMHLKILCLSVMGSR